MSSTEIFDVSTTAEHELPASVQECINTIINKDGYETYKVDIKPVSTDGGSYLGYLYEIDIKGETIDGEKETNLFVKATKEADNLDGLLSISDAYLAEGYFYKELSKLFADLEDNGMVPLEERFNMIRCYEQTDVDAIILENLAKKGFKTLYRMDVPSLKFVELCMQEIAKFHAFSFIIQKRDPKYFIEKIASRKSSFEFGIKFEETAVNMARTIIKYFDDDMKKKLEEFLPVYLKKIRQHYKGLKENVSKNLGIVSRYFFLTGFFLSILFLEFEMPDVIQDDFSVVESRICCLCHADFRLNNTLMRERDGEIEKVILIDYQLIKYGCPVDDFIYFIYSCTDREFRSQHLEHIKNVYHDTLSRFLQYFDIDAEQVYPRKEFERILDDKKDFGLIIALYCYPWIFVLESEVPDFSQDDFSIVSFEVDPRGRKRFLEIVEELWG